MSKNINFTNIANAIRSVAKDAIVAISENIFDQGLDVYQSDLNRAINPIAVDKLVIPRYNASSAKVTAGTVKYISNIFICTQSQYDALVNDEGESVRDQSALYLIKNSGSTEITQFYFGDVYVDLLSETIVGNSDRISVLEEYVNGIDAINEQALSGLDTRISTLEDSQEVNEQRLGDIEETMATKDDVNATNENMDALKEALSAADEGLSDSLMGLGDSVSALLDNQTSVFLGIFDDLNAFNTYITEEGISYGWAYIGSLSDASIYQVRGGEARLVTEHVNITSFSNEYALYQQMKDQFVILSESEFEAMTGLEANKYYMIYEDEEEEQS